MALIKCKECGNEISDKASSCPKCGWNNNQKSLIENIISFLGPLSILGIILDLFVITNNKKKCAAKSLATGGLIIGVVALLWFCVFMSTS